MSLIFKLSKCTKKQQGKKKNTSRFHGLLSYHYLNAVHAGLKVKNAFPSHPALPAHPFFPWVRM